MHSCQNQSFSKLVEKRDELLSQAHGALRLGDQNEYIKLSRDAEMIWRSINQTKALPLQ